MNKTKSTTSKYRVFRITLLEIILGVEIRQKNVFSIKSDYSISASEWCVCVE